MILQQEFQLWEQIHIEASSCPNLNSAHEPVQFFTLKILSQQQLIRSAW